MLLSGPSVSPSPARVRLNCRSSVGRLCRRSTAGTTTTDPFQLSGGSHRRRRKGIDLVAKQWIVPTAAAGFAVFVHQRGMGHGATEHIDDHVVVVVVGVIVLLLGGFTVGVLALFLLVGAFKVVRVKDAAVQALVVRVVQLTIAAAATGGAATAAAPAVVVATLGRGAGDWSLAVAGHPSPAALGGGVQACTSRFPPRFRRWRVRGCCRRRSCTRSRCSTTIALSIGCGGRRRPSTTAMFCSTRRRCRRCRHCSCRVLMIDVIVLVVVAMVRVMFIAIAVIRGGVRFRLLAVHGRRRQGGRGHADTSTGANLFVRAGLGGRGGVRAAGGRRRRCSSSSCFGLVRRGSAATGGSVAGRAGCC